MAHFKMIHPLPHNLKYSINSNAEPENLLNVSLMAIPVIPSSFTFHTLFVSCRQQDDFIMDCLNQDAIQYHKESYGNDLNLKYKNQRKSFLQTFWWLKKLILYFENLRSVEFGTEEVLLGLMFLWICSILLLFTLPYLVQTPGRYGHRGPHAQSYSGPGIPFLKQSELRSSERKERSKLLCFFSSNFLTEIQIWHIRSPVLQNK